MSTSAIDGEIAIYDPRTGKRETLGPCKFTVVLDERSAPPGDQLNQGPLETTFEFSHSKVHTRGMRRLLRRLNMLPGRVGSGRKPWHRRET